jgi:hypothetical protein
VQGIIIRIVEDEGEKGRKGEKEKGRRGEGEKGRRGEGEKGGRKFVSFADNY